MELRGVDQRPELSHSILFQWELLILDLAACFLIKLATVPTRSVGVNTSWFGNSLNGFLLLLFFFWKVEVSVSRHFHLHPLSLVGSADRWRWNPPWTRLMRFDIPVSQMWAESKQQNFRESDDNSHRKGWGGGGWGPLRRSPQQLDVGKEAEAGRDSFDFWVLRFRSQLHFNATCIRNQASSTRFYNFLNATCGFFFTSISGWPAGTLPGAAFSCTPGKHCFPRNCTAPEQKQRHGFGPLKPTLTCNRSICGTFKKSCRISSSLSNNLSDTQTE